jgi:acetyltransferase-like isoleucine patch superfamily enzyme
MATLRHKLANIISVSHSMIRLSFLKVLYPKSIFFKGIERFSPDVVVDTDKKSKIQFGSRVSIHSGGRIAATSGGKLSIGNRTSFNVRCIVACRYNITIGQNVAFGPNVMIYDHNHIMDPTSGVRNTDFELESIDIGDNCWIGAGTIILSGAHIGNNCVIAAGSVVKGTVPDHTVLIQKRTNTYKGVE